MALPDDCKEGDYVLHRVNDQGGWMAEAPCYEDPQASPVGYGKTHQEAVDNLVRQPQFQEYLKRSGDRPPSLDHFTIDDRPAGDYWADNKWKTKGKPRAQLPTVAEDGYENP